MQDLFLHMIKLYGLREIPGADHNEQIVNFFAELGYPQIDDDETAWCAASLNFCCKTLDYEYPQSLLARDWLNVGQTIQHPKTGDVVVFWRIKPNSKWGHVGLYVTERDGFIWILGGNQSNMVKISAYPKYRLLGYRRPRRMDGFN